MLLGDTVLSATVGKAISAKFYTWSVVPGPHFSVTWNVAGEVSKQIVTLHVAGTQTSSGWS